MAEGLYKIREILGSGAYAFVVVASPPDGSERRIALKVLREQFLTDATVLDRFHDEAQILMRFNHPNIVDAFRLLNYEDRPVLEMELVKGVALESILRNHRDGLSSALALHIVAKVAEALQYGWEAKVGEDGAPLRIIHRDVKPNNVLISTEGAVKVVDFGIAKGDFDDRKAKSLYMVHGSIGYDPPERKSEAPDTPAIDVYALGIMLFVLLTGRSIILSHKRDRHDVTADKQLGHLSPEDLKDPKAVRNLIRNMIQYDSALRPSMAEVLKSLERMVQIEGLKPDMAAFAAEHVQAAYNERQDHISLANDSSYSAVRFLETDAPTPPRAKMTRDQMSIAIRKFLSKTGWEEDVPELQRLITRCDTFVEMPFLDLLDRASVPKWKIWRKVARPAEVEATLMILCDHPSEQVLQKARKLLANPEQRVAAAARFVVAQHGG